MMDPHTGAICERLPASFYSDELRVILTTGQRHKALPPDVKPHLPYGLPTPPKNGVAAALLDAGFQAELNDLITHRMADPTRKAYIAFTPYHLLHDNQRGPTRVAARLYKPESAGITLLVNPLSRHLEAYDHSTLTVSQFRVSDLDPHIAFDVLSMCETPAAAATYNQGLAKVMRVFSEQKPAF